MAEPESGLSCRSGLGCRARRVFLAIPLQKEKELNSSLLVRRPSVSSAIPPVCSLSSIHTGPHCSPKMPRPTPP